MKIHRVTSVNNELVEAFERLIPQLTRRNAPSVDELLSLINSPSILLIARYPDDSGPIAGSGTLGVFRTPTGVHGHIEDVIVDSACRNNGIGETLVMNLLSIAKENGLDGVSLTCNPSRRAANTLYEKMGFKKWDTNVYWYDLNASHNSANL